MYYDLSETRVAVSDELYRKISDQIRHLEPKLQGRFEKAYRVVINISDGTIRAHWQENDRPQPDHLKAELHGTMGTCKIVALPTPPWVRGTEQEVYLCVQSEIDKLMREWWKEFAERLR